MALTTSNLVTAFGAYFRKEGTQRDLVEQLRQPSVTEELFTVIPTEKTQERLIWTDSTRVLQRFQNDWTPVGDDSFEPETINLSKLKINKELIPDDIEQTYAGFLAGINETDRQQWPIVRYVANNAIVKAKEDYEINEIYKGVLGTVTAGTATAAGASMNGIEKIFVDSLARTGTLPKVNQVTMGVVPTDPVEFVTYVESFVEAIPELERGAVEHVVMNQTLRNRFRDGMRLKYNINYQQTNDLLMLINYPIKVVGVRSMTGKNRIWATYKSNSVVFVKNPANQEFFDTQRDYIKVKLFTDYFKGIGFRNHKHVWISDVA